jgi:hypothetical protein
MSRSTHVSAHRGALVALLAAAAVLGGCGGQTSTVASLFDTPAPTAAAAAAVAAAPAAVPPEAETGLLLSGAVSGLPTGQSVALLANDTENLTVTSDGAFTFPTRLPRGGSFTVTVATQPTGAVCTVGRPSGSGIVADVTDIAVTCSRITVSIGGTVTGLAAGRQITLRNNAADPVTLAADGAFTFATRVAYGSSYQVDVGTAPSGQVCTVANAAGTGITADRSDVAVVCRAAAIYLGYSTSSGLRVFTTGLDGLLADQGSTASDIPPSGFGSSLKLVFDAQNRFAYSLDPYTNALVQHQVGSDGALIRAGALPVDANDSNVAGLALAVSPGGRRVYVGASDQTLRQVAVGADGTMSAAASFVIGANIRAVSADPLGRFAYAFTETTEAYAFAAAADGALTPAGSSTTVIGAESGPIAHDSTGRFVYAASGLDQDYTVFGIGTDGVLQAPRIAGTRTWQVPAMQAHPSRALLYVLNVQDTQVWVYQIGTDGTLTSIGNVSSGADPRGMTLDASGRYLYVLGGSTGEIVMYRIDTNGLPVSGSTLAHGLPGPGNSLVIPGR